MGLVLFLTNQCNLRCKYCFVSKNKETMSMDTYKKAINDYKDVTQNVTFFGGEPLLCFDRIKEIVDYNEKNQIKVSYNLNTNALLLEGEVLDYCLEKGMLLNVSLDGSKESNLKNRCNEEQFQRILKNIKDAIHRKGKVIVNYVIDPNNIYSYYEGVKFLVENDVTEICLMINYDTVWTKKDIQDFKDQNDRVIDYLVKKPERIKIYPIDSEVKAIVNKQEVKKCNFGRDNLIVSTQGNYYPCMHFMNKEDYKIHSREQEVKNTVNISKCLHCNYLPYCSNNCMCKNAKQHKESEVDVNCEFEKIFIRSATNYIVHKIDGVLENEKD